MSTAITPKSIDWAGIGRESMNPLRVAILEALAAADEPRSPSELSDQLDERLGNVSYHVRTLLDKGYLRLVSTTPRRGAVEHHYRLTPKAYADGTRG